MVEINWMMETTLNATAHKTRVALLSNPDVPRAIGNLQPTTSNMSAVRNL